MTMAEGVGFEPTLGLLLSLISSQVPSTTQPPFRTNALKARCAAFLTIILCARRPRGKLIRRAGQLSGRAARPFFGLHNQADSLLFPQLLKQ